MPSVPRRPGRQSAEHQAAVARRLELLRVELSATPALHAVPDPPEPASGARDDPSAASRVAVDDEWWSSATRIRGLAPTPAVVDDPVDRPALPSLPAFSAPGRHASRRRASRWPGLLPDTLRGRVAIGPAQLTVVVALLCLGLAALAFTAVRGRPQDLTPVAAPVPVDASPSSVGSAVPRAISLDADHADNADNADNAAPPAPAAQAAQVADAATAAGGSPTSVTVDVAGKVRRPGIAVLDPGARVVDALEAAGGARRGVDLSSLNLARPLVDGEQILVGIDPPPGAAAAALMSPASGTSTDASAPGVLVDLNAATDAELDTLPDVGPVTAQSIITWREEHGGFTTVDELLEVDGIGEATLAKLAPHVTV